MIVDAHQHPVLAPVHARGIQPFLQNAPVLAGDPHVLVQKPAFRRIVPRLPAITQDLTSVITRRAGRKVPRRN